MEKGSFYLIFILFHVQIENGWFLYSEDDFYISFGLVVYSFQLEIPKQLFGPNVFNVWMILFLNILGSSVPLEGQPAVPKLRKSWGWWKVKKWTTHRHSLTLDHNMTCHKACQTIITYVFSCYT